MHAGIIIENGILVRLIKVYSKLRQVSQQAAWIKAESNCTGITCIHLRLLSIYLVPMTTDNNFNYWCINMESYTQHINKSTGKIGEFCTFEMVQIYKGIMQGHISCKSSTRILPINMTLSFHHGKQHLYETRKQGFYHCDAMFTGSFSP